MQYHLLDVFTHQKLGGNPLAVFPDPPEIDASLMQRIAAELGLSETVFVLPPRETATDCRLRIFTPRMELDFAGHPTVGTAVLLSDLRPAAGRDSDIELRLEENVGVVVARVRRSADAVHVELLMPGNPRPGPPPPSRDDLAALLQLSPSDLAAPPDDPCAASAGVPYLIIPVADASALGRVRLDLARWRTLLAAAWAPHVYVVCQRGDRQLQARMFAPAMGIEEDPATGAAVAALPIYLARRSTPGGGAGAWTIAQGVEMGRPSRIDLRFDATPRGPARVRIGGAAVRIGEGRLYLP